MMTKAKSIGTRGETAVVNWLREYGFPNARRLPLSGVHDMSDIEIDPLIPGIIEMKWRSPKASTKNPDTGRKPLDAQNHTAGQLEGWLAEAYREGLNYSTTYNKPSWCALIVNRFGKASPNFWHVYVPAQFAAGSLKIRHKEMCYETSNVVGATLMMTGAQFLNWLEGEYQEVVEL